MLQISNIISAMTALIGIATTSAIPAITDIWCVPFAVALFIIGVVVAFIFGLAGSRGGKRRK